ncbi:MAG: PilZ domain-containing protein, partial [bacterium]|nr:PilZ domain-containing protein [bacterium]
MEKRQFFRFATCVPVKFFNAFAPGQGYSGMVTNISAGGARIFLKDDCQNLNYVVMNMHLPNGVLLDLVNARVIYNGKEGDGT